MLMRSRSAASRTNTRAEAVSGGAFGGGGAGGSVGGRSLHARDGGAAVAGRPPGGAARLRAALSRRLAVGFRCAPRLLEDGEGLRRKAVGIQSQIPVGL